MLKPKDRILITRDRDYGGLVFIRQAGAGVVYLRVAPSQLDHVHAELRRVLDLYSETELLRAFIVVERGRHRIRRLPSAP